MIVKGTEGEKKRRTVLAVTAALILAVAFFIFITTGLNTDITEAEYEVSGLDMRIAVSKDQTYEVEEFISVDISNAADKIEFAIPDGSFKLKDLTVENEKARAVKRSSGKYVVIRDPRLMTAGHHRYRITYRLTERKDTNEGRDVFSFNVLPEGWKQPVYKLHALMWFPYGFPLEDIQIYADESPDIKRTVKIEPQSRSFTLGLRGIPEDYSLRVGTDFPDGYWEH